MDYPSNRLIRGQSARLYLIPVLTEDRLDVVWVYIREVRKRSRNVLGKEVAYDYKGELLYILCAYSSRIYASVSRTLISTGRGRWS